MPSDIALGLVPFLDVAVAADATFERRVVPQRPDFTFEERGIAEVPGDARVFVAIDNRYLNFKRLELAALLAARGIALASVVARSASVAGSVGTGVFVGEGAVVGPNAVIGDHACIGARAVIGPDAKIGRGAWIEPGAIIGTGAAIGAQTTVGSGVVIAAGIEIGELCVLAIPGLISAPVAARTYHHPLFHEPIRVISR